MDLKRRLASLDRLSRRPTGSATPAASHDTVATLQSLGLSAVDGPRGRLWVRDYRDPLAPPGEVLPDLGGFFTHEGPGELTAADLLFIDTETTGLVGGTGTIPFLTGASWWEGEELVTRQFFLAGPGREGPVLEALAGLAAPRQVVVTFNGASFDLPLLRTRARLERRPDPFAELVSWDLLVPSRRLWGNGLDNCRQQTLEEMILGRQRGEGDIEGHRIPQTWFDFLASGAAGDLPAVLRHNRRDMTGMAGLLVEVVAARRRLKERPPPGEGDWRLAWSLGRICERRRDDRAAGRWMGRALAAADPGPDGERFLRDVLRIVKRTGDWEGVAGALDTGLAAYPEAAWLHREAAIHYEHRRIDLDRALRHAIRSGEERRSKRLEMKVSRRYRGRRDKRQGDTIDD